MNKLKLLMLVLLATTIVAISCSKKDETNNSSKATIIQNDDPQKMINYMVKEWGYKKEDIQEMPDRFVIQGDMAIPKKDFWTGYTKTNDPTARHYRGPYLVTAANVIYVGIDPSVPTEWKNAYIDAMSKWNSLNGRISFYNCNCSPAKGVWVSYQSFGSGNNDIANTTLPTSSGYAGTTSIINSTHVGAISASQKLFTAVHELGHTIGFGHTDEPLPKAPTLITTATTSCNTSPDHSSVMYYGNTPFAGFSYCDIAAFKVLYPK